MLSLMSSSLQRWPTTASAQAKAMLSSPALLSVKALLASTMSMSKSSSSSTFSKRALAFVLKAAALAARHLLRPARHHAYMFKALCTYSPITCAHQYPMVSRQITDSARCNSVSRHGGASYAQ